MVIMNFSLHLEEAALDLLEEKIQKLESQVYGYSKPENDGQTFIKTLLDANTMLNAAANSHQNVQSVYRRLPELNTYLTEETLLDPSAEFERKLNLVVTLNEDYTLKVKKLEEIAQLQSSMDKQSLKCVSELKPLLADVMEDYLALNNKINEKDTMRSIASSGQQLVQEVSKSLVATNTALCQLEISKQKK